MRGACICPHVGYSCLVKQLRLQLLALDTVRIKIQPALDSLQFKLGIIDLQGIVPELYFPAYLHGLSGFRKRQADIQRQRGWPAGGHTIDKASVAHTQRTAAKLRQHHRQLTAGITLDGQHRPGEILDLYMNIFQLGRTHQGSAAENIHGTTGKIYLRIDLR